MRESEENWLKRLEEAFESLQFARAAFYSAKKDALSIGDLRGSIAKLDLVAFQGFSVTESDVIVAPHLELTLEDLEI